MICKHEKQFIEMYPFWIICSVRRKFCRAASITRATTFVTTRQRKFTTHLNRALSYITEAAIF